MKRTLLFEKGSSVCLFIQRYVSANQCFLHPYESGDKFSNRTLACTLGSTKNSNGVNRHLTFKPAPYWTEILYFNTVHRHFIYYAKIRLFPLSEGSITHFYM